jgi:hypothetical protein
MHSDSPATHVRDPTLDTKRGQIGNVFPGPKKHRRRPHLANNAERSPTVLGAMRDQPREDIKCNKYNII